MKYKELKDLLENQIGRKKLNLWLNNFMESKPYEKGYFWDNYNSDNTRNWGERGEKGGQVPFFWNYDILNLCHVPIVQTLETIVIT